jgi:hypothetical protein
MLPSTSRLPPHVVVCKRNLRIFKQIVKILCGYMGVAVFGGLVNDYAGSRLSPSVSHITLPVKKKGE